MKPQLVTIGVYGFTEEEFFGRLAQTHVDTFCDTRARRGMRGSTYAYANSTRLQERLGAMGIRYFHVKELAPDDTVRQTQKQQDKKLGIAKRARSSLGEAFVSSYQERCLRNFKSTEFLEMIGPQAEVVCLFCVEGQPEACHRSIAAVQLSSDLGLEVSHIRP